MTFQSKAVDAFTAFHAAFKKTDMWRAMVNTRENSPWHREENVGVHTQMLLDWYMQNLAANRSETQRMLTLVACLFHDVGKPPAQVVKFREDRGEYRAYHGHEQLSARMWVDYAMTHEQEVQYDLRFTLDDVANVALMLERHVPFDMKDEKKRKALKDTFMTRMGRAGHQAWLDLLLSDQHGRVSDDQAAKLERVDVWMKEWEKV